MYWLGVSQKNFQVSDIMSFIIEGKHISKKVKYEKTQILRVESPEFQVCFFICRQFDKSEFHHFAGLYFCTAAYHTTKEGRGFLDFLYDYCIYRTKQKQREYTYRSTQKTFVHIFLIYLVAKIIICQLSNCKCFGKMTIYCRALFT